MTLNLAPAEDALGMIKMFPELHYQKKWRCESGMCLAGHIAQEQGVQWVTVASSNYAELVVSDYGQPLGSEEGFGRYITRQNLMPGITMDTRAEYVSDYVRRLLGLTYHQAEVLFGAMNTVEDLERGIKALANGQTIRTRFMDDVVQLVVVDAL